jgi:uracil phosphoribosyltransferase
MNKIILKATDIDNYLTVDDVEILDKLQKEYDQVLSLCQDRIEGKPDDNKLIYMYDHIGKMIQAVLNEEDLHGVGGGRLHVYSFSTPSESHSECSRLIAKLRDKNTGDHEFTYYIQRAYEMLYNFVYGWCSPQTERNHLIVETPVTVPVQNFAVHKIRNYDRFTNNSVMCVMLRGALLPSMIMSKEIEEYSSNGYKTPFALFKISRDDTKTENDMEYVLDLDKSYFKPEQLDGKDLIFADPMNASGGSLIAIVKYLESVNIKPKSIKFINIISAMKGSLRILRALPNCTIYTLWMDPVLNSLAYILPGAGDVGDRIHFFDNHKDKMNIMRLIANYGSTFAGLYNHQLATIEQLILNHP